MPHKVGIFADFAPVYADFPFVFKDGGFDRNFAVAVFRFCGNFGELRAVANKLLVVTNAQGRARTEVKHPLRTVGFPLRVLPEQYVQAVGKLKLLILVVSEILKE